MADRRHFQLKLRDPLCTNFCYLFQTDPAWSKFANTQNNRSIVYILLFRSKRNCTAQSHSVIAVLFSMKEAQALVLIHNTVLPGFPPRTRLLSRTRSSFNDTLAVGCCTVNIALIYVSLSCL